jgi:hypothetical protein
MKSEYRQAVESVITQEAKLAEAEQLHRNAVARISQTAEWVKINKASLRRCEDRLAELEAGFNGSESQASG